MTRDDFSFDNLPDNLDKEAGVGFFETEGQKRQLALLSEYISDNRRRPIFVTGPPGFGKTTLVRMYLSRYPAPQTEVLWVDFERSADPVKTAESWLDRIRTVKRGHDLLIVLDGAEGLQQKPLERFLNQLFNWKAVRNVIVITRNIAVGIRGAREIIVDPPADLSRSFFSPVLLSRFEISLPTHIDEHIRNEG
jgi:predicted AAA+ superfamily ATPase